VSCRLSNWKTFQFQFNQPDCNLQVVLNTLISLFRCNWLGIELNSSGHWPPNVGVEENGGVHCMEFSVVYICGFFSFLICASSHLSFTPLGCEGRIHLFILAHDSSGSFLTPYSSRCNLRMSFQMAESDWYPGHPRGARKGGSINLSIEKHPEFLNSSPGNQPKSH